MTNVHREDIIKRCVCWAAVSSEEQSGPDKASLPVQIADNRAFVEGVSSTYPGHIGEIIKEIQMSDSRSIVELSDACRMYPEAYGVLYDLIKSQSFDLLICRSRDRLGRKSSLVITLESLCHENGILVIPIKSAMPLSLDLAQGGEDRGFQGLIEGYMSEQEIRRFVNRRELGMKRRIRDGIGFASALPYGYRWDDPKRIDRLPVVDDEEAAIVRRILIDLYLGEGRGAHSIARILNTESSQSAYGKRWASSSVGSIIARAERYAGWLEYNKRAQPTKEYVRGRGNYQTIISDEELERIEREKKSRFNRPVRRSRALFTGVVFCTGCNMPMIYHRLGLDRSGKERPGIGLRCNREYCKNRMAVREKFVEEALGMFLDALAAGYELPEYAAGMDEPADEYDRRIDAIKARLARVGEERSRIIHAYTALQIIDDEDFVIRIAQVDAKAQRLEEDLAGYEETRLLQKSGAEKRQQIERMKKELAAFTEARGGDLTKANRWLQENIRIWIKKSGVGVGRIESIEII